MRKCLMWATLSLIIALVIPPFTASATSADSAIDTNITADTATVLFAGTITPELAVDVIYAPLKRSAARHDVDAVFAMATNAIDTSTPTNTKNYLAMTPAAIAATGQMKGGNAANTAATRACLVA